MKWDGVREHCENWKKITYGELLSELVNENGSKTAVVCDDISITYTQLDRMSDSVLAYLLEKGLCKGDIAIMQMPNSIEFVVTLFALFKGGIIPVMALPTHGKYEISGICKLSSPKAYICMDTVCHSGCVKTANYIAAENDCIKNLLEVTFSFTITIIFIKS